MRRYIGVDNAVEISVVTASGAHITTNEYQNSDLFWALRGGGGGTFGIVTSVTYQTHPSTPVIATFFDANVNSAASGPDVVGKTNFEKLFTEFVRLTPAMADGGWAGYMAATTVAIPGAGTPSMEVLYMAPNVSWAAANATMNPFLDFAESLASDSHGQLVVSARTTQFDSFSGWYENVVHNITMQQTVGLRAEITSRLLPQSLFETDYKNAARTLLSIPLLGYK